ncbi:hypothetical protein FKW77_002338 [Venturia effusa]|uniref:Uncharacterized protein n=1 Tax=Venturia effusa TaxID=50376 RepID=A0A517KVY3_9PEZI|nr:hypothetical protein FKW77_002338 [Venturia effusa]
MSDRPGHFPGHKANSDFTNSSSYPRATAHGHDLNRGRELRGTHRLQLDDQTGLQVPQLHGTGFIDTRESFMVPHTGRVFAEHQGMSPYDWPSINRDDPSPPGPHQQPESNQPTSGGLQLGLPPTHQTDYLGHVTGSHQDRAQPELKRNLSAKEKLLAKQRKPTLDPHSDHRGVRDYSSRRGNNASPEKFSLSEKPNSSPMAGPQGRPLGRVKKGPPVAYNRNAANVEQAAARGIAPYFSSSGHLRESRTAAGVDTFIQSLKDRPLPANGTFPSDHEHKQTMLPPSPGRRVSFDTSCEIEPRQFQTRKFPSQEEGSRNDDEGDLNFSNPISTPQSDLYGSRHQYGSPAMRPPICNASFESPNPAYRSRPDSYQMFDPQYHRNNGLPHRQQGRPSQGYIPVQPQSNLTEAINNGTMQRNRSIHFNRGPGSMPSLPTTDLRATVSYNELQKWAEKTISLYRDVRMICCQCNAHSELCNDGHKEGRDLRPFTCWGNQGHTCCHIPCSDCYFHSKGLKRMAAWPTRRTLDENTLVFGSVRWTWLCYRCGTAKRTDHPSGSHPLSWEKKWQCNGCGKDWNDSCPTFLMEERDVDELNRAAERLLRAPVVRQFFPEAQKERRDLGKRVEGVVHKAGKEFKKLLEKTEVQELIRPSTSHRPSTSRSHSRVHRFGHFGERFGHPVEREKSSRKDSRKITLGRAETMDRVPQRSPRRSQLERSPRDPKLNRPKRPEPEGERSQRHERREAMRQRSSPQLGAMGDVDRKRGGEIAEDRRTRREKMDVPKHTAHKRKNSMF